MTVADVLANSNNFVFASAVSGVDGFVKLAVYKAAPYVHLKFVIKPLKTLFDAGVDSVPMVNGFVVSLKL